MKKVLFAAMSLSFLVATGCCNQVDNVSTLTGQLDSVKNGALVASVTKSDFSGVEFTDTIQLDENGKFTYTLDNSIYRDVTITGLPSEGKRLYEERFGYFQVSMLPGECVNVTGTLENPQLSGSKFYTDKERAEALLNPLKAEMESAVEKFSERLKAGEEKAAVDKEYDEYIKQWRENYDKQSLDLIKSNPDDEYSYYMAVSLNEPIKSEAMALLTERVKNGPMKSYDDGISAMMKAREERRLAIEAARKVIAEGKPAPDFTLNDLNGKPLALSSLRGKYVVLDFWGSWCGWCIKGIPEMKKYYQKYDGKLEILGIACGDTEEKWKNAVEEHQIPWLNVINNKENGVDVSSQYAITGYPTKIVIDPNGNIAKVIEGEGPAFYNYLDNLFK